MSNHAPIGIADAREGGFKVAGRVSQVKAGIGIADAREGGFKVRLPDALLEFNKIGIADAREGGFKDQWWFPSYYPE